jgi:hypothetical protein
MDKSLLERYLSETESALDTARLRLRRQATVVRLMKDDGKDVAHAVELMTQFERVLAVWEGIQHLLLRQLGRNLPTVDGDD